MFRHWKFWSLGIWGLVLSAIMLNLRGAEPDFERLFPISPYEQVYQALIKVWGYQHNSEKQLNQLTKLMVLVDELGCARSQIYAVKQNASDLDYLVRLLDHIQLQLPRKQVSQDQVKQAYNHQLTELLSLVRIALVKLI